MKRLLVGLAALPLLLVFAVSDTESFFWLLHDLREIGR